MSGSGKARSPTVTVRLTTNLPNYLPPKVLFAFPIPPVVYEISWCNTSLPILGTTSLFNCIHANKYRKASHCAWICISLTSDGEHLCMCLPAVCIILCVYHLCRSRCSSHLPMLYLVLFIEFREFFIYSKYNFILRYAICEYVFPCLALCFHPLTSAFWREVDKVLFIVICFLLRIRHWCCI